MSQRPQYTRAISRKAEYTLSLAILFCVATFFENCQVIDDDSINAVCTADCTTIQGRFTTKDGNTPIPDMRLDLDWSESGGGLPVFLRYTRKIAVTETDDNGNYSIVFFAEEEELASGAFRLRFDVPDKTYLQRPDDQSISIYLRQRDTVIVRNYHLPKLEGNVLIRLTNPEAIGPGDRLICNMVFKYEDLSANNRFHGIRALDTPDMTVGTYPTAVDQYTYIRLLKRKNGQDLYSEDSIIVGSKQTVNYEVMF
jgi:hypothetical protein